MEYGSEPKPGDEKEESKETTYLHPDYQYVSQLMMQLQWELQGRHQKIADIEALKHYEDWVEIPASERRTGMEVHIGLAAELLENVKAAVLANTAHVKITGHRNKEGREENQGLREKWHQAYIASMSDMISELVDAQLLGYGVLKSTTAMEKWNVSAQKRRGGEEDDDWVSRVEALRKMWGPPIGNTTVHPIASYFRVGERGKIEEFVEQGYVAKRTVLKKYKKLNETEFSHDLSEWAGAHSDISPGMELGIPSTPTQPNEFIRPLPHGMDTSQYYVVTQYWNPECYQIYVHQQLVHAEYGTPKIRYFIAKGKSSASTDPDKFGISVAENMRVMEPVINLMMTRMVEAADLIINRRNTLEVPDTYIPEQEDDDDSGSPKPKTWVFTDEYADTLPPGAKLVDAYAGAERVFQGLPLLQLMLQIIGQHGVSPLFKGVSPGAAGSGYRDNSLYLMAKQQFEYIIENLQNVLADWLAWIEWLVAYKLKKEVWVGEHCIKPSDITEWPASIQVVLQPTLPQNRIAEGEFGMNQYMGGAITMRRHREEFLNIEQPDEEELARDFEDMKNMAKPQIWMEAMQLVMGLGQPQESGLVDTQGNSIPSSQSATRALGNGGSGGQSLGRSGQQLAGRATGGQPKSPEAEPGQFPPPNQENR